MAMFVAVMILLWFPDGAEAETRRGIVIGLGEQLDSRWNKINGDRDVPLVVGMLKANGFSDITTLVNERATKVGIKRAIEGLTSRCRPGDVVYIHFSGHGQLMTDLDGDETEDGMDESWIPYDAYRAYGPRDRGEKHISDDELNVWLSRLHRRIGGGGALAVVVDACHSGDSTRGVELEEETDSCAVRGVYDEFKIPAKRRGRGRGKRIEESWLTLSACQDFQLNQEYKGVGKLTHILTSGWRGMVGKRDEAVFEIINRAMQSRRYKGRMVQNPDLSGKTGEVFAKIIR